MTDDLAKWNAISANEASNNRGFWNSTQAAFITSQTNKAHNKFMLQGDRNLANTGFNPQHMEQHSWEKL